MDTQAIYQDILTQFRKHLEGLDEPQGTSLEFVVQNLSLDHVEAALWMHQKHEMSLIASNFHNLIANWEQYQTVVNSMPDSTINFEGAEKLAPTDFHPARLMEYLKLKQAEQSQ